MLEIKNLSVSVRQKNILQSLSLSLDEGKLTVLIGKNGCGKSTLISCIGGMRPYTGEIHLDGAPISSLTPRDRARRIAILPQLLKTPHMSVERLVSLGRTPHLALTERISEADTAAIEGALASVGIADLRDRFADELSGGERQKAYLAMTLAQEASILILDEPTTYMDVAVSHGFMEQLSRLKDQQKKTVLAVMHDLNCALRYADRVAVMDEGRIVFHGTTDACLATDVIERTFGVVRHEIDGRCFFEG